MIPNLACNIVVRNESERLKVLFPLIRPVFSEIVLVDQESTDDTVEIAKEYCDLILSDKPQGYADPSRPTAARFTNSEWIIPLDADEFLTKEFVKELPELIDCRDWISGYFLNLATIRTENFKLDEILDFQNNQHKYSHASWPNTYRLFRRDRVIWPNKIHIKFLPPHKSYVGVLTQNYIVEVKSAREHDLDAKRYEALQHSFYDPKVHI